MNFFRFFALIIGHASNANPTSNAKIGNAQRKTPTRRLYTPLCAATLRVSRGLKKPDEVLG